MADQSDVRRAIAAIEHDLGRSAMAEPQPPAVTEYHLATALLALGHVLNCDETEWDA